MRKKFLVFLGVLGVLLIIAGVLFNPALLGKLKSSSGFQSEWTVAKIHLIRYYMIIIGVVLSLGFLIIQRSTEANRNKHFLTLLGIIGIVISITAVIFSPSFVEHNFSSIKFLEDHNLATLITIQVVTITLGFLIILFSFLAIHKRYMNSSNRYSSGIIVMVIVLYFIIVNATYFKLKYPANIISKPGEYVKVLNLLLGHDILLSDFDPKPTLHVKHKHIIKAKYPVIDMNFHLNSAFQTDYDRKVLEPNNLVKSMDSIGVKIIVNTDGISESLKQYSEKYPDRFINFSATWFPPRIMFDEELANLPKEMERQIKLGSHGNGEIWKYLGLKTRDASGKIIPLDDLRLDPLWNKAAELGVPILWHMGDPAGFFQPVDRFNERYEELRTMPDWGFYGTRFPSREEIFKQRENVFRKHPKTIFIGAHLGFNPDNLEYVGYLLETYPNYYVEMSSVLSDLGRQPNAARKFFIKYQDRILFATDGGNNFGEKGWTIEKYYRIYFEFLETDNEYFEYPLQGVVNQGNWKIYGINLPDEVLEKIYYKNAEKILKISIK